MRELAARGLLHRAALSDPDSLDVARSLVDQAENPALYDLVGVAASAPALRPG